MRKISTTIYLALFGLIFLPLQSWGQMPPQLIIANGGQFGPTNYATVAAWNLSNNNYFIFDSIPASSVQDVLIDGQYAYVAADSIVRKYDLDDYSLVSSAFVTGVRSLALSPNQGYLVAARGFPISGDYVRVMRESDLSTVADVQNISGQCEGIVIVEDTAYVTVPGGFGSLTGKIALVDLTSQTLIAEVNLDTMGEGITDIFYNPDDAAIYSLSTRSFGSTTGFISQLPLGARIAGPTLTQYSLGYNGGTMLHENRIYGIFDNTFNHVQLNGFNPYALGNSPMLAGSWAGHAMDTINKEFYLSKTDYASWGSLHRYDSTGTLLDTIPVGISPEAFDIDGRIFVGTNELLSNEVFIKSYPNPFTERVTVDASRLKHQPLAIEVFAFSGQRVFATQEVKTITEIDLSTLPAGNYLLKVRTEAGDYAQHLLRQ